MEILLAVLAAFGACAVLTCLALCLLAPFCARGMTTVWRVRGNAADLEYRVRLCVLLQRLGLLSPRMVLADCGLTQDARKRAELLCADLPRIDLVAEKDLLTYFEMRE